MKSHLDFMVAGFKSGFTRAIEMFKDGELDILNAKPQVPVVEQPRIVKETIKYLDSREVAKAVGKEHSKLLRDIKQYEKYLNELKVDGVDSTKVGESNFGFTDFFISSSYISEQNKELPCYLITQKGCELIAHKMTGAKGVQFSAWYINKFHEMKDMLSGKRQEKPLTKPKEIEFIESDEVEVKPEGMLTATEIAKLLGVSRQKIGKLSCKYGLKTATNGRWAKVIAPNGKPVNTFFYNKCAIEGFKQYI